MLVTFDISIDPLVLLQVIFDILVCWFCYNGVIQFQKADLAIADLTINTPRNDAIDFSMPFMKLGEFKMLERKHT